MSDDFHARHSTNPHSHLSGAAGRGLLAKREQAKKSLAESKAVLDEANAKAEAAKGEAKAVPDSANTEVEAWAKAKAKAKAALGAGEAKAKAAAAASEAPTTPTAAFTENAAPDLETTNAAPDLESAGSAAPAAGHSAGGAFAPPQELRTASLTLKIQGLEDGGGGLGASTPGDAIAGAGAADDEQEDEGAAAPQPAWGKPSLPPLPLEDAPASLLTVLQMLTRLNRQLEDSESSLDRVERKWEATDQAVLGLGRFGARGIGGGVTREV
jgi:hypothetical protein